MRCLQETQVLRVVSKPGVGRDADGGGTLTSDMVSRGTGRPSHRRLLCGRGSWRIRFRMLGPCNCRVSENESKRSQRPKGGGGGPVVRSVRGRRNTLGVIHRAQFAGSRRKCPVSSRGTSGLQQCRQRESIRRKYATAEVWDTKNCTVRRRFPPQAEAVRDTRFTPGVPGLSGGGTPQAVTGVGRAQVLQTRLRSPVPHV